MTNKKVIISPKKKEIFEKAAELFQQKGYKATSMRELADAVNLEVSSLYSHIKSKTEILEKVCFDTASTYTSGLKSIDSQHVNPKEKIHGIISLHVDVALNDPKSITVFNDEWRHLPADSLKEFLSLRKAYERKLLGIIREGISQKKLRDINAKILLQIILSATNWIHTSRKQTGRIEQEEIKSSILRILERGIFTS